MGKIRKFEDLIAWQKAQLLALEVYRITRRGEFSKDFGLRNQIQRAVVSVMSNIAEGFERYGPNEFQQFLSIARGSSAEVRSQLHLAQGLSYVSKEEFDQLYELCLETSRLIGALRTSINQSINLTHYAVAFTHCFFALVFFALRTCFYALAFPHHAPASPHFALVSTQERGMKWKKITLLK